MDFDQIIAFRAEVALSSYSSSVASSHTRLLSTWNVPRWSWDLLKVEYTSEDLMQKNKIQLIFLYWLYVNNILNISCEIKYIIDIKLTGCLLLICDMAIRKF